MTDRREQDMANTTQQTLTIRSLERLRLSALGNPSVRVTFSNGLVAQTVTDGQVGSMIENSEYRDVPVLVTFNAAGRIVNVAPAETAVFALDASPRTAR
jgi:hypothetical protein